MNQKVSCIFIIILVIVVSCNSKEESLILGNWKVVEYSIAGTRHESRRCIEFNGSGNYLSYEKSDTISGEWRMKHNTLVLYQPEIKDMHGTRQVESFTRVWEIELAENWMMLTGTARSNTSNIILVLKRQ